MNLQHFHATIPSSRSLRFEIITFFSHSMGEKKTVQFIHPAHELCTKQSGHIHVRIRLLLFYFSINFSFAFFV